MDAETALAYEDTPDLAGRTLSPGNLAAGDKINWLDLAKCNAHSQLQFKTTSLYLYMSSLCLYMSSFKTTKNMGVGTGEI